MHARFVYLRVHEVCFCGLVILGLALGAFCVHAVSKGLFSGTELNPRMTFNSCVLLNRVHVLRTNGNCVLAVGSPGETAI